MLYIIDSLKKKQGERGRLIEACKKQDIQWQVIDADLFEMSEFECGEDDGCYRISTTKNARLLEIYLRYRGVRFLYKVNDLGMREEDNLFKIEKLFLDNGVVGIPTKNFVSIDEELLSRQVGKLGGFPIIVKEHGSFNAKGIVKVDSMSALLSVLPMIKSKASGRVVLKKYIEHDEQARIIVLDGKVVGQKANVKRGEEIRLNTGSKFAQEKRDYPDEVKKMAIKAVELLGLKFGGVDILIGNDGKYYVAEVNMPCAFTYVEDVAGVDIAGQIVKYLNK